MNWPAATLHKLAANRKWQAVLSTTVITFSPDLAKLRDNRGVRRVFIYFLFFFLFFCFLTLILVIVLSALYCPDISPAC